jgi:L-threonylcarbamoyladenylate synthase
MTDWLSIYDPGTPRRAAEVIRDGGLVILPTDTVYGVAADVWQPEAVAALYRVKQRPADRAIPILLADPEHMNRVSGRITPAAERLAAQFWPGPLTIIVAKHPRVPDIVSSLPTVGLRIPAHDATRAIIRACGGALAVTSANLSDHPSPLTAQEAAQALGEDIALVIDGGECTGGVPSTVVDASTDELKVIRTGPLDPDTLRNVKKSL